MHQFWTQTATWLENIVHIQAASSVVLLVGFLVTTTLLQQRTVSRVAEVLKETADGNRPIANTKLFEDAQDYFGRRNINLFTDRAHIVPVWFLIFVVFSASFITFFGAELFAHASTPSYALGGALAAVNPASTALAQYQSSTLFTGAMAFFGAYVWMIARLTTRINNNDMSATTYYFLSIRLITACILAGVTRHVIEVIPYLNDIVNDKSGTPVGLAAIGFIIGWNPTLWIKELVTAISNRLKRQIPVQRWPKQENLPQNMALEMIQGLVDDKIDRLNELDIDNCQDLAERNPVVIWVRTPFTLELIVDWIAQAQLCILFEDVQIERLRQAGVRDIFTYLTALGIPASQSAIADILKPEVPAGLLQTHAVSIPADPAYHQLKELRDAL